MSGVGTRGVPAAVDGSSCLEHARHLIVVVLLLAASTAHGNPIPDAAARAMNERPARWLAHRDSLDERGLIYQFSQYGMPRHLLAAETIELLEREFDQFAPLCIRAQTPPSVANAGLQRWFRERADTAQANAMKLGLREWLTAPLTEAPEIGGMRVDGPPEAVAASILGARRTAAEALGDWRDTGALPGLRALLETLPAGDPVIASAIRRISDPDRPEVLNFDRDHRVVLGRRARDLDSVVVSWSARGSGAVGVTKLDRHGRERAWTALGRATELDRSRHPAPEAVGERPYHPDKVSFHFRDGDYASVQLNSGPGFWYDESGRPGFRPHIVAPGLVTTLIAELVRVAAQPLPPRFVEESVWLTINPGEQLVRGEYYFEGTAIEGSLPLRYPMAAGPGLGPPIVTSMKLRLGPRAPSKEIPFEQSGHEARVLLAPGQERWFVLIVEYRQQLTGRLARYLVTTARAWGQPLRRGRFVVEFSTALGEPKLSMPFQEVSDWDDAHRRFEFNASPFEPGMDIEVTW